MPGRTIPAESALIYSGYGHPDFTRRRSILNETLDAIASADSPDYFHRLAATNLARWENESQTPEPEGETQVLSGDWGEIALAMTKTHGRCFAVLNMANAYVPGGAYVEGAIAQEENMFRRTDCHFRVDPEEYDATLDRYRPEMTQLLSAKDGLVYLDINQPRVCIRGPEDRSRGDLGYPWLADDQVFPFFELRAAAQDLRDGSGFNSEEARRRIAAQFDTLLENHIRYAVLSAFGCGAFQNPANDVAQIYREEIDKRRADFSLIAFAIFAPGYGPDNYTPFVEVFDQ